jgi:hypothetical protein
MQQRGVQQQHSSATGFLNYYPTGRHKALIQFIVAVRRDYAKRNAKGNIILP